MSVSDTDREMNRIEERGIKIKLSEPERNVPIFLFCCQAHLSSKICIVLCGSLVLQVCFSKRRLSPNVFLKHDAENICLYSVNLFPPPTVS